MGLLIAPGQKMGFPASIAATTELQASVGGQEGWNAGYLWF